MSVESMLTVRPLSPDDYDAVRAVWDAAGLSTRPTGRDARDAFLAQLRQFPSTYLGALDGDRLVGVVLGTHDHRKGWINRLAVHPDCRRQGVARLLLEQCEAALQGEGIEIIAALIDQGNEASREVFRRGGYLEDAPVYYCRKRARTDI